MCRVHNYCGCQSLYSGCITIGIVCIVLASLDIIYSIVGNTSIHSNGDETTMSTTLGLRTLMDILLIVFSGIMLCGTRRKNVKKIKPWIGVTIAYCVCLGIEAAVMIYAIVVVEKDEKYFFVGGLIFLLALMAYLIYAIIVVRSYRLDLKGGE